MSTEQQQNAGDTPPANGTHRWLKHIVVTFLVLGVLGAAAGISVYWLKNRPKAKRQPPKAEAALVEVVGVKPETRRVVVEAMGTVVPAREIRLAAQVGGEVISVSPDLLPGGLFGAGESLLKLEPRDYELAVRQRNNDLAKARSDLRVEMGQQSISRREYELLGQEVPEEDRDLLLRLPQLEAAQATVASAEATLEKAELDLERTRVVAPFNAVVQSREADLGTHVSAGSPLVSLIGSDEYWVQVSVPVDRLRWIDIPGVNSKLGAGVRIYQDAAWGPGIFRKGVVQRLMTDLEPEGRMARLLVSVSDPLHLHAGDEDRRPLLLGAYVRVQIDGRELPDVVSVPRDWLRSGEQVWVMDADGTLDIRQVEIAWSGNDLICISRGLDEGDLLVTSSLGTPVQGMALRTSDSAASQPAPPVAQGPDHREPGEEQQ
jgi:RND family efflux transporter MFP subunit